MKPARRRWLLLPLAAVFCVAAESRSLSGMETPGMRPPAAAAELFLGRLKQALAARPDLRLTGTGEKPILTGSVFFDSSTLYLPGGRMQFEPGAARFQPPDTGRPSLELNGHGRLQGYDVVAVVEGPYDQPTVTLSSAPVLTNEELLLLVLSGQAPKTRRGLDSERSRHLDVAFFLGRDMMSRIEGHRSNDTTQSIMDRFDVDVGRNATRSGEETVRVLFRIAGGVFGESDSLSSLRRPRTRARGCWW